jgi:hypothetical protein
MELYDDTVFLTTLSPERTIAVLIHDADVATMLRLQFDWFWNYAPGSVAGEPPAGNGADGGTSGSNAA